jgi:hypothetical protein
MLIANPIYDNVFKYLMEDLEIAKGVISTIINTEIDHLTFQAQESITRIDNKFSFYHLDFVARIRQQDRSYKTVLIEMQKTNLPNDIIRFRRYLGQKYRDEDEVILDNGKVKTGPLPIINIYLLGFYLSRTLPAVIKVDRRYIDVIHGVEITERNEFIECLSHDSYVIQIPALQMELKNRLEYVLSIFMQENFISKENHLKDYRYETEDTLMKKILHKLQKAAGDREFLRQMEVEEMAYREYETLRTTIETSEKRLQEKETEIKEKETEIKEKETEIKEKDKVLREKEMKLQEKDRQLLERERYIKELQEKLNIEPA